MDLIAIFPRVRHSERCLLSEDSCLESGCALESVGTTHPITRWTSLAKKEHELLKQFDAAWLAGFQAESKASKVSSFLKERQLDHTVRSSTKKTRQNPFPNPLTGEIRRRRVKELESTEKTQKRQVVDRQDVDKSRMNIRLAALYLPSLTLWFLSLVAAVIWLGVFFVERQPIQHEGVQGIIAVRFAETLPLSYEEEKSRQ